MHVNKFEIHLMIGCNSRWSTKKYRAPFSLLRISQPSYMMIGRERERERERGGIGRGEREGEEEGEGERGEGDGVMDRRGRRGQYTPRPTPAHIQRP